MSIHARHVFDSANDFRAALNLLRSRMGEAVFPVRSSITVAAFAVELYLKCLLVDERAAESELPKTHDLAVLYGSLDAELRRKIDENFERVAGSSAPIREFMIEFRNTFEDWRYIYESQGGPQIINIKRLFDLVEALHGAVRDARPEWSDPWPA